MNMRPVSWWFIFRGMVALALSIGCARLMSLVEARHSWLDAPLVTVLALLIVYGIACLIRGFARSSTARERRLLNGLLAFILILGTMTSVGKYLVQRQASTASNQQVPTTGTMQERR